MDQLINDFSLGIFFWQVLIGIFWIAVIVALVKLYLLLTKYLKLRIKQIENDDDKY